MPADVKDVPKDTVLVRFENDGQITQGDFEYFANGMGPRKYDSVLSSMVRDRWFTLYLKAHPGLVDEAKVDQAYVAGRRPGQTAEQQEEAIKKRGMTIEFVKDRIRIGLGVTALQKSGRALADDPAYREKLYQEEPSFFNGTEISARHVFVPVYLYETPEQREAKRNMLAGVRARLAAQQITWQQALQEAGGGLGGDLGWFTRYGMQDSIARAAFAMKPGETSDVIDSDLGFHVVEVLSRRDGSRPVTDEQTVREMVYWLEQKPLFDALREMQKKYPLVGVRPPTRTPWLFTHEVNMPRMDMPSHPTGMAASRPATRPAK